MTLVENSIEQWKRRLEELRPAVEEYEALSRALEAVSGQKPRGARQPQRLPFETRRMQLLSLVEGAHGPVPIRDLADGLGVSVPRAVQIVNRLEEDGEVTRRKGGVVRGR